MPNGLKKPISFSVAHPHKAADVRFYDADNAVAFNPEKDGSVRKFHTRPGHDPYEVRIAGIEVTNNGKPQIELHVVGRYEQDTSMVIKEMRGATKDLPSGPVGSNKFNRGGRSAAGADVVLDLSPANHFDHGMQPSWGEKKAYALTALEMFVAANMVSREDVLASRRLLERFTFK